MKYFVRLIALVFSAASAGCVTLTLPTDSPSNAPAERTTGPNADPAAVGLLDAARFEVWDMHGSGSDPASSEKIIDSSLAVRGYWISSSTLGMPREHEGGTKGAGRPIDQADLSAREQTLRRKLRESGISGTSAMVMLDAEAFQPYDSATALAWYNQTARVASEHFSNWFWYFQPYRYESSKGFADEDAYYDWYAQQDFIRLASAISVTVYHGREQDAHNPASAKARMDNDRHLKRAIEFARQVGKPLIVTVRADLSGKPREAIMSRQALEASWGPLFQREGVDGIAIWNSQPADMVDFDRQWATQRIEPVLRKLLAERAAWQENEAKP